MISPYIDTLAISFIGYLTTVLALQAILAMGQLPLCGGFWFGFGCYVPLVLLNEFGIVGTWFPIVVIAIITGANAILLIPTGMLRGKQYAFYTLALQMAYFFTIVNLWDVTGGHSGIIGIPVPRTVTSWILGTSALLIAAVLRSRFRLYIMCIGGNELLAVNMGIPTRRVTYVVNFLAGCLAGLGGAVVGLVRNYTDPTFGSFDASLMALVAILLVGTNGNVAPVLAAALLTVFPELLRSITTTANISAELRYLLLGVVLIAIVRARRETFFPREVYRYDRA